MPSTVGLGFVLLQKSAEPEAEWKIVQAGSRFLSDVEGRYAVVELECLAVVWDIKKCSLFLSGLPHFTVVTDHSPLIPILNTYRLDEKENPRLQRLRTRILSFHFMTHNVSSPHYPQSNGKAEATVKSMKKLISSAWTGRSVNWNFLSHSLLQYRNTPCRKDSLSPAQKLFGHPVQDTLPAHRRSFDPEWQKPTSGIEDTTSPTHTKMELAYNQHTHDLSEMHVGSHVALQNPISKLWDVYGVITAIVYQDPKWQCVGEKQTIST